MAQINPKQSLNEAINGGGSHSRSLSQPTFFGSHGLPPLSPHTLSDQLLSLSKSNPNSKSLSMEEMDVTFRGCSNGLPPRRGHRRTNSDVALGFSAMIQSPSQLLMSGQGFYTPEVKPEGEVVDELLDSLINVNAMNVCDGKDKDSVSSGSKMSCGDGGSNSDSETASRNCASANSREGVKRAADGDITPPPPLFRHSRSLSMDSGIGKLLFEPNGPSNLLNENSGMIQSDGFSDAEMKKIMMDERLAVIAMSDPKRVKRILANRQSAARSKERKLRYISELEHKVQTLQSEATNLSAQITTIQNKRTDLVHENKELKLRFHAMEQQSRLQDALHETLLSEVQRLKIANMELLEDGRASIAMARYASIKHQMISNLDEKRHPNQQQQSGTTSESSGTTSAAAPA
ncbi:bZIP transcription factor 29-like [Andrographis paniculata]|uniref:bZIP transcription factor 29-like n=1 Tax=Andrographis paniculata TaxID=175694 RepID=UPI0021E76190|nr:bZIP transcription factor 29-like [Andrographis paniculata]XP_051150015.1 bZIP transcription factor 29-like [Andrographis paniculata]